MAAFFDWLRKERPDLMKSKGDTADWLEVRALLEKHRTGGS